MRVESASAIEKLLDTVKSVQSELDSLEDITDMSSLGRMEDRIRNECQVIEALPGYLGQEVFRRIQKRRTEIRREQINHIRGVTEVTNGSGNSRTSGDTRGTNKSGRPKQKGNSKA